MTKIWKKWKYGEDHIMTSHQNIIQEYISPDTSCLWWANKEFKRGEKLFNTIGKNEKTKLITKLTKVRKCPSRLDCKILETKRATTERTLFIWRRAERNDGIFLQKTTRTEGNRSIDYPFSISKKMEEDQEDSYLSSPWANPKGLKNAFQGVSNITWKPGSRQ